MNDYLYIRSLYDSKIGFFVVLKALRENASCSIRVNEIQKRYGDRISTDDYLWIFFNEGHDFIIRKIGIGV